MPKGFALHIGLNEVDSQHYSGWDGELVAAEADAKSMESIARSLNYNNISMLLTNNATIDNVVKEIKKAASTLESGDIFFLTYSGHGGQVPDQNNDESDGLDETWCLYDGEIIDDELYSLWPLFKEDVRIIVLSDSCHSGTIIKDRYYGLSDFTNINPFNKIRYRFIPRSVSNKTFEKNRNFYAKKKSLFNKKDTSEIKCAVKLISGCQDNQFSSDGANNGLFTATLLSVWKNGEFEGDYKQFYNKIVSLMPPDQTPNLLDIGKKNVAFDNQKPFEINSIALPGSDPVTEPETPTIDVNSMNTISINCDSGPDYQITFNFK